MTAAGKGAKHDVYDSAPDMCSYGAPGTDKNFQYLCLVEPVRVADREGQLDIDTTGVCELLWSNHHAWMSSKVLSYQLQLAPKVRHRSLRAWLRARRGRQHRSPPPTSFLF